LPYQSGGRKPSSFDGIGDREHQNCPPLVVTESSDVHHRPETNDGAEIIGYRYEAQLLSVLHSEGQAGERSRSHSETRFVHTQAEARRSTNINIEIFISHSSIDAKIAEELINLLRSAIPDLRPETIRCTSVPGYRLPGGAKTDEQLQQELLQAKVFIGLLSGESAQSTYVLFELGARWGAKAHLLPLMVAGMTASKLRAPLNGLNAHSAAVPSQLFQLIDEVASLLGLKVTQASRYEGHIKNFVNLSQREGEKRASESSSAESKSDHNRVSDLVLKRRISAFEVLWSAVLDIKDKLSMPTYFYTILAPHEYDSALEPGSSMDNVVKSITDEFIHDSLKRVDLVENERPYLGDILWSLFFTYRAFLGRLATLIVMGKKRGHIEPWQRDNGVRQILSSVFSEQELKTVLNSRMAMVDYVVQRLQLLMLDEIRRISSEQ
jgi:hypothetical protein